MMTEDLEKDFGTIDFGNMSDEFMRKAGMVRASFGLYSTHEDVDILIDAVKDIIKNADEYARFYEISDENNYVHKTYHLRHDAIFNIKSAIDDYLK